jgi:hypothetical protein
MISPSHRPLPTREKNIRALSVIRTRYSRLRPRGHRGPNKQYTQKYTAVFIGKKSQTFWSTLFTPLSKSTQPKTIFMHVNFYQTARHHIRRHCTVTSRHVTTTNCSNHSIKWREKSTVQLAFKRPTLTNTDTRTKKHS